MGVGGLCRSLGWAGLWGSLYRSLSHRMTEEIYPEDKEPMAFELV